jgi:hypothetical protein
MVSFESTKRKTAIANSRLPLPTSATPCNTLGVAEVVQGKQLQCSTPPTPLRVGECLQCKGKKIGVLQNRLMGCF